MDDLSVAEQYLRSVAHRDVESQIDDDIRVKLNDLKCEAVKRNDQNFAKTIWCYEETLKIQIAYLKAFSEMQEHFFYPAWCTLERVEIELHSLERHFKFLEFPNDPYKLKFIYKHTTQFQSLFPYLLFSSPGYIAHEKVCTICGKPVSIRQPCGHMVGEIYDGQQCGRYIAKADIVEISLVTNPVHKSSVAWIVDPQSDEPVDNFNYCSVDYVMRGLRTPFSGWDMEWVTKERPRSDYGHVGRNELCPCGSGEKFKKCCIKKSVIDHRHLSVRFYKPPVDGLPGYEEGVFVKGKGSPKAFETGPNLMKGESN